MYFNEKFTAEHIFLFFACGSFYDHKSLFRNKTISLWVMGPKQNFFLTSICPSPHKSKNATKVYYGHNKQIISEYKEKISALGKVRQKLGNNQSFLQKYQLHQISTSTKFTLPG